MEGASKPIRGNDLRSVADCRLAEVDALSELERRSLISWGHAAPTGQEPG